MQIQNHQIKKIILLRKIQRIRDLLKFDKYDKVAFKLTNALVRVWNKKTKDAIKSALALILSRKKGDVSQKDIDKALKELRKKLGGAKLSVELNKLIYPVMTNIYIGELESIAGVGVSFDLVDKKALKWMSKNTMYWIGKYYSDQLSKDIAKIGRTVLAEGLDRKAAAKLFGKELGSKFGRSKTYWDMFANHVVTRSREFGRIEGYVKTNTEYLQVKAVMDHRTSKICRKMNNKIVPVSWGVETRNKIINSKKPETVKEVSPWYNDKMAGGLEKTKTKDLPHNLALPPYHGKCRTRTIKSTKAQWKKNREKI